MNCGVAASTLSERGDVQAQKDQLIEAFTIEFSMKGDSVRKALYALLLCGLLMIMQPALGEEPPEITMPEVTAEPAAQSLVPSNGSWLDDDGILRLVNRELRITKDYVPADLVTPRVATRKKSLVKNILMREKAARALEDMFEAARIEAGHTLYAASGYRSYGIQQILFNQKVEAVGSRDQAQKTVAPAGTSEHQLGLAMDVQAPSQLNLNRAFGDTEEGQWVAKNAHRFGFIIRYKREWTDVTGYLYEPWHIRYIGVAHAMAVHSLDIPLEHYIGVVKQLPEYVLRGATDHLLAGLVREQLASDSALLPSQLLAARPEQQQEALRAATLPYLAPGLSYESALWAIYPTPKPTAGPRVDLDEETSLFSGLGGGSGIAD